MGKHFFIIILFLGFLVSCAPDQIDPEPGPRYIPYAIYELTSASFDTISPRRVVEYQYNESGSLIAMRRRYYTGNPVDHFFQFKYDASGNIISQVLNGADAFGYTFTYEAGYPKYANCYARNLEFFYDGAGNLLLKIDSTGPRAKHWRADSLKYSYSDSGIKVRRIITITSPLITGEAQSDFLYFNPSARNPFDQLKTRVDFLPTESAYPSSDYMRYAKRGMIREYQMVKLNGELDASTRYEILAKKQGTDYPSVIKVTHRLYPPVNADPMDVFYQHILYREL